MAWCLSAERPSAWSEHRESCQRDTQALRSDARTAAAGRRPAVLGSCRDYDYAEAVTETEAAELLDAPDVVATNAIHASIAAADAITCSALGERSADSDHGAAVDLLRQVDASLAAALKRSLDRKTQAAYESDDISNSVALSCVKWAKKLVSGANRRLET